MKVVLQRVREASVTVEDEVVGSIGVGYLLLVGIAGHDDEAEYEWMANKVAGLRVFNDAEGKMNLDLSDVGGAVLAVSQFTLFGDCKKGRRPSFVKAGPPDMARAGFERFCEVLRGKGLEVATGVFQAHMEVRLWNDGPVTLLLESPAERRAG